MRLLLDRGNRGWQIGGLQHLTAPAAEQRLHAVENLRIVVDAQHGHAGELAGIGTRLVAPRRAARDRGRHRHFDGEHRSATGLRLQLDRVVEHARDTFHDREAEPETARDLGAVLQAMEFTENRARLRGRNAKPGVVHVDPQAPRCGGGSRPARAPSACI